MSFYVYGCSPKTKNRSGEITYHFLNNMEKAEIITEEANFVKVQKSTFTINNDSRLVIFEHPDTEVIFKNVSTIENEELTFGIGIAEKAWDKEGDGVLFEVSIVYEKSQKKILFSRYIDPKNNIADRKWWDEQIDLSAFAGKKVSFIFKTTGGTKGDLVCDWAGWSNPQISRLSGRKNTMKTALPDNAIDFYLTDEDAGHIHKPDAEREYKWKEHVKGRIVMQTNNLGFREDKDTPQIKPEKTVRILVTGDSHIDGVVYNSESFPNLLEDALNSHYTRSTFEIINGGTGLYGPHNYAGFLKKYMNLKPDMFIVVVYTGNDFQDAAMFIEKNTNMSLSRSKSYFTILQQCESQNPGAAYQALNQIFYFKTFPDMQDKVIEFTQEQLLRIKNLCIDNGIELFVILLPTKVDVEWKSDAERLLAVTRIMGLNDKNLQINQILTKRISFWLKQSEITYLDLSEPTIQRQQELFWKLDYHLNTSGHKFVSDTLFDLFLFSHSHLIEQIISSQ